MINHCLSPIKLSDKFTVVKILRYGDMHWFPNVYVSFENKLVFMIIFNFRYNKAEVCRAVKISEREHQENLFGWIAPTISIDFSKIIESLKKVMKKWPMLMTLEKIKL